MNILKGSVLKVFGAVVLVSMIGALVAEPVVLGDIGVAYYLKYHNDYGYIDDGKDYGEKGIKILATVAAIEEVEGTTEAAVLAACSLTGIGLVAVGVTMVC
ncbi:hypothetical protein [Methanocaldococcus sp.]